jgi:hypothetical protein
MRCLKNTLTDAIIKKYLYGQNFFIQFMDISVLTLKRLKINDLTTNSLRKIILQKQNRFITL